MMQGCGSAALLRFHRFVGHSAALHTENRYPLTHLNVFIARFKNDRQPDLKPRRGVVPVHHRPTVRILQEARPR